MRIHCYLLALLLCVAGGHALAFKPPAAASAAAASASRPAPAAPVSTAPAAASSSAFTASKASSAVATTAVAKPAAVKETTASATPASTTARLEAVKRQANSPATAHATPKVAAAADVRYLDGLAKLLAAPMHSPATGQVEAGGSK